MNNIRSPFANTPPVVKNLVIINVLMLLATWVLATRGIRLENILGLHYIGSPAFKPYQLVTHLFMHGGFTHLLFNMFALWMFGRVLENVWGPKRFFIYYFATGLGAAALHTFVGYLEYQHAISGLSPEQIDYYRELAIQGKYIQGTVSEQITSILMTPTVGASGAVYGVLIGFGMLFPNTMLMLIFPPIPIKAKYAIGGMILIEVYLGFTNSGGNIAHFAHLGGALFGFLIIKYWNKNSKHFF
ncbi:rhomboid family intramembrane serine protease [Mangrovibacterium diazotrophicum]|uniref:Membrane associated rhomboid family serine protease n=1 Tax=Mangrovibacterium diazotrophicum TaxID=1261403 RepID=A0A419WBA3_9BACT|nr:rhomboid family intramembrane serine protease [Mangrovibacterium diazotrophicum]RKD92719.1 membrane associated rhomboid family serine protease [Mangrovibacterium diazotrophicum]